MSMDLKTIREELAEMFAQKYNNSPKEIKGLPLSGSNRKYFRIVGENQEVIATYNEDYAENKAFFYLGEKLKQAGVNVPEVIAKNEEEGLYLQEDLGDVSLFDYIQQNKEDNAKVLNIYKKVIDQMPLIQVEAAKGMDFSICYPRESFDEQSVQWDLNYFKYMFLKFTYVSFHEQLLEDEFQKLIKFLMEAPSEYFLFRDFQSRNIMVKDEDVYFIDYQGGRKGALQYDLASLLFEAKIGLSDELRKQVLEYYIEVFGKYSFFNAGKFTEHFPAFVLVRLLQAFGAYGYRGLFEKKAFFVQSIVKGLKNLEWVVEQSVIKEKFPYLCEVIYTMFSLKEKFTLPEAQNELTVTITSFSYKKGVPDDWSGNGGGFVFDCRALANPGRYEEYRGSTGMDKNVQEYLEKEQEVLEFVEQTREIVTKSVKKYIERGFSSLSVSFGCTGGQHRSVYSAQKLYEYLKMNFQVNLRLIHREMKVKESYVKNDVQKI